MTKILDPKSRSVSRLVVSLFGYISKSRQKQFLFLFLLTAVSSIAEVISLGAVIPFIGILIEPDKIFKDPFFLDILSPRLILSTSNLIILMVTCFALVALISGFMRIAVLRFGIWLGNVAGADIGGEVYRRTLYQSYLTHINRNSGDVIGGVALKASVGSSVLISITTLITSSILFLAILTTLLLINPVPALIAATTFSVAYAVFTFFANKQLVSNSKCIAREQVNIIKSLQEGLGSIRDVILDGSQEVYFNIYKKSIFQLQVANGGNAFINQAPRYAMETLGIVLVSGFILLLNFQGGDFAKILPLVALLALGAQKLLPLMQQIYGNWSLLAGSKQTIQDVLNLLEQPLVEKFSEDVVPLNFYETIELRGVWFQYDKFSPWVLKNINLTIPKGAIVGIIGATGTGKSTLVDLVMGLIPPSEGMLSVDGISIDEMSKAAWMRSIAHVPQSIFLADATVAENIAFGVPVDQIDIERVKAAARSARIDDVIESRAGSYASMVGENGVRLSGGQRQRIGIARALYKQASVLIFDEATSSLDAETEAAVMDAIHGLSKDLTIIMIAHRISTLKICTEIFELNNGKVTCRPPFKEFP